MQNIALSKHETADRVEARSILVDFIETQGFNPGDRLPPERELMVRLGMSRSMLRKALDALEHDGRIWRHVGKGTFIAAPSGVARPGRLADLASKVTPHQVMRARLSLEPAIAREAAINASEADVRRLFDARDGAREAVDWDAYEAADDLLHRAVAEATGNVLLLELFEQLNQVRRAVAWSAVVRTTARPPRDHSSFAEHDRLAAAISARNPVDAHSAMKEHLGSVAARLFGEV
ncbi:FadR/GntR family transcriptional regulator [Tropicimonas sp. S265A]|uniref:FadR/GntR family transcriptional regulator n=1 Tax=Tropicimonas sp. S265A TaxID=3415134 RepID=UPI003C7A6911